MTERTLKDLTVIGIVSDHEGVVHVARSDGQVFWLQTPMRGIRPEAWVAVPPIPGTAAARRRSAPQDDNLDAGVEE